MPLITQVADKDRQRASLYPYPVTPILGAANFISGAVVVGILAYFVHYLRMDNMSAPSELIFVLVVACISLLDQILAIFRHSVFQISARINLVVHLVILSLWCAAFGVLTWRLNKMVLSHTCSIKVWETSMGVMVCRLYKAMYSFSAISFGLAAGLVILDYTVLREDAVAGIYRPLEGKSKAVKI
ncbi:hypothetical protein PV08_07280 [Exophiala spinifera]|uniref:MARVEL domain-containing protein n=1 Tax=Exophiala spinifera TaxID=91928 RepID=A0A0D1YHX3_9EURO|nr:uncharacterized protein PV08_07280 [Exophiala spinifera]KIW14496.1 hypothetical protein PV08_07280 [Exophiala spinifera]